MLGWWKAGLASLVIVAAITSEWTLAKSQAGPADSSRAGAQPEPAAGGQIEAASHMRISGTVRDLAGDGIPNAKLKVVARADSNTPDSETRENLPSDPVVTNVNGEFSFDAPPIESDLFVFAINAVGFETNWTEWIPVGTTKFRIVLKSHSEADEEKGMPVETISGQVFDRVTKRPIPGALVGLQIVDVDARSGIYAKKCGPFVATAITDDDGQYRIEVPSAIAKRNSFVAIWAHGKTYQPSRENSSGDLQRFEQTGFESPIWLTPCEGGTICLADAAGNPVANAKVKVPSQKLHESVPFLTPVDWTHLVSGTTDDDGFVTLMNVIPVAINEVEIQVPGHDAPIWLDSNLFLNIRPAADVPHFEWSLPDTGELKGRLVAGREVLPKNLFLEISTNSKMQNVPEVGIHSVARVKVDEDGCFRVQNLAEGLVFIKPFLPMNQPLRAQIPVNIHVFAGKTTTIEIPIENGVHVRGQIIQSDTGKGHPGVHFQMIYGQSARPPMDLESPLELKTDRHGRFETLVPPGPIVLRLPWTADDYSSQEWWSDRIDRYGSVFEVPAGDEYELEEIEFVPTEKVSGKVFDMGGKPMSECTIYGYPDIPGKERWLIMNSVAGVSIDTEGQFDGRYPSTYPPKFWKVSHRRWPTPTEFVDEKWYAEIESEDPLVLKVDTKSPPLGPFE